MKNQDWQELINDCPLTTEECEAFFSGRAFMYVRKSIFHLEVLMDFLWSKGIQLEMEKFRKNWLCKVWIDGELIAIKDETRNKQLALANGIKEAFYELES